MPRAPPPAAARPGSPLPVPGSPGHGAAGAGLRWEPGGPQGAAASRCPPPACVPPRLRSGAPHCRGEVSQDKEEEEEEEEVAEEEEKEGKAEKEKEKKRKKRQTTFWKKTSVIC